MLRADRLAGGKTILIVEDNLLVAMELEAVIEELGYAVGGRTGTVAGALHLLRGERGFDMAILDVNLGAETSFPVADALVGRAIPFIFATGYGPLAKTAPPRHAGRICIAKPYSKRALREALTAIGR